MNYRYHKVLYINITVCKYSSVTNRTAKRNSKSITMIRDFNITSVKIHRSSKQKISRNIKSLTNTINKLNILAICRILLPTTENHNRLFKQI